ncbi:MAG: lipase family protein [Mycobacteriales bacterium]
MPSHPSRNRAARWIAVALLASAAAGLAGPVAPASAATVLPPGQDPFYRYTGSTPLGDVPPGTVLKERSIDLAVGTTVTPVTAEQLLYRTTGELGQPTVTVTTVLVPTAVGVPRLVGYLSFYDALGAQCDPSYTLQGGNPGAANQQQTEEEEAIISTYVGDGFVVTVPDFEGENLDWTAGQEAGYGSLDALTATEHYLGLPASTPVGLTGYSGGSIGAEWASELAPSYAPHLNLIGVAAGGVPVDYAHNLAYINGSSGWSGIIPAALVALTRAFQVDLTPYLSPYGAKLASQVQTACIGSFFGAYPGLKYQQLLGPQYQDIYKIPAFVRIINRLIMGSTPGHPTGPLFLAVGDADGTGDGVMVTADVEALAHEYCQQGVPLQLAVYQGSTHTQAALHFEPAAIQFLQERFAGVPFSNGCSSVPAGDSIAPLAIPSSTATAAGSAGAHGAGPTAPSSVGPGGTATGALAVTGLNPAVPLAALVTLLAGLGAVEGVRRSRRRATGVASNAEVPYLG